MPPGKSEAIIRKRARRAPQSERPQHRRIRCHLSAPAVGLQTCCLWKTENVRGVVLQLALELLWGLVLIVFFHFVY